MHFIAIVIFISGFIELLPSGSSFLNLVQQFDDLDIMLDGFGLKLKCVYHKK